MFRILVVDDDKNARLLYRAVLERAGYTVLAAEPGGLEAWEMQFTYPLALVFGNEALGVSADALEKCDGIVSLPMNGSKASINVGNAAAAITYAIDAKRRGKLVI